MATLKEVLTEVKSINKLILGNGEKGVFELIRNNAEAIETQVTHCKTRSDKQDAKPDIFGRWVIRVIMAVMAIGQFVIAYKLITK